MKKLGRHLIVEYADCDQTILNDLEMLEKFMNESVRKAGATIVSSKFHRYNPQGVSGVVVIAWSDTCRAYCSRVVVIAESHISIHTWPEYGYAAVDFFTCGESVDPYKAYSYMKDMLKSHTAQVNELERGIPSDHHEILAHKPVSQNVNSQAVL